MTITCNKKKYNHLYIQGPIPISRGEVAQTIYDWILVQTVAFDFKINSRSRGRRSIAALSDIGGYRCCSIRNAMFSVFSGNQIPLFLTWNFKWIILRMISPIKAIDQLKKKDLIK